MKKRISLSISGLVRKVGYRRALHIAREAGFDAVDYRVGNECAGFDLYGQGEDAVLAAIGGPVCSSGFKRLAD